jgi:hypothetical protein
MELSFDCSPTLAASVDTSTSNAPVPTSPQPSQQPAHPVQLLRRGKPPALVQRGPIPPGDHRELMNVHVLGSDLLAAVTLVSVEQPRQSVCDLEWMLG